MEDIAKLANKVVVMHKGKVVMEGSTREIFTKVEELRD